MYPNEKSLTDFMARRKYPFEVAMIYYVALYLDENLKFKNKWLDSALKQLREYQPWGVWPNKEAKQ